MNDQIIDLTDLEARIAIIEEAGQDLRNEVSKLHTHVTQAKERDLKFLHRQFYDLKKVLFFADLEVDEDAFNGQFSKHLVWQELKDKIDRRFAIETGTYLGGTTALLSQHFERVITVEVDIDSHETAKINTGTPSNVDFILSDSAEFLRNKIADWVDEKAPDFFYLDAHWEAVCPLLDEVEIISRNCPRAIVMIDDMEVPGDKGYGFDHYETAILDINYLAPVVERFNLACFVPRVPSAKDCMSKFMINPRGTWFIAQDKENISKLESCKSLRRI